VVRKTDEEKEHLNWGTFIAASSRMTRQKKSKLFELINEGTA